MAAPLQDFGTSASSGLVHTHHPTRLRPLRPPPERPLDGRGTHAMIPSLLAAKQVFLGQAPRTSGLSTLSLLMFGLAV